MNQDDYQKRYTSLVQKITRLRGLQREWYKTRALSPKEQEEKKRLEREVDTIIKDEKARQNNPQKEMF